MTHVPLYLDAVEGTLRRDPPVDEGAASYASTRGTPDRPSFADRFERSTEITGGMSLRLWMSTTEGDDMDLFVLLRKFDAAGREVYFYGYNGFAKDGVANGWLRVSHRELDIERSRPGRARGIRTGGENLSIRARSYRWMLRSFPRAPILKLVARYDLTCRATMLLDIQASGMSRLSTAGSNWCTPAAATCRR